MKDLTNDNFELEVVKSDMPVLVDFWAPWCGPCKFLSPTLEKLSKEYTHKLKFAKLNVDEAQELSQKFDVRGIPCLIVFSKGNEVDRIVGNYPEGLLRSKLDIALTKA